MQERGIDPRTDLRWESPPTHDYRVVFWRGGSADERDVSDAEDVHEVIRWADTEAGDRGATYTLFAKVERGDERGLVWLAGIDPTVWSQPNFDRPRP